jgi:hypothetical protein
MQMNSGNAGQSGEHLIVPTKFVGCSAAWGTAPLLGSRAGGAVPSGTAPPALRESLWDGYVPQLAI